MINMEHSKILLNQIIKNKISLIIKLSKLMEIQVIKMPVLLLILMKRFELIELIKNKFKDKILQNINYYLKLFKYLKNKSNLPQVLLNPPTNFNKKAKLRPQQNP
jgi:hypothetical protein